MYDKYKLLVIVIVDVDVCMCISITPKMAGLEKGIAVAREVLNYIDSEILS